MLNVSTHSAYGVATLLGLENVGPATAQKLIDICPTLGDVLAAAGTGDRHPAVNQKVRVDLDTLERAHDQAERMIGATQLVGGDVLSIYDGAYPRRLASIPDAPMLIHVIGDISTAERSAGCVGTRNPSRYGVTVTQRLAGRIVEDGLTIVSGLADGVDWTSHEVALSEHGVTVAAIGSGLDRHRNPQARQLADRIVSAGGAIISEAPCGTPTDPNLLIRRNRIISGLSCGVFIMQADLHSGTMHTVRYALHQGRPVFTPMPPDAFAHEEVNRGNIALATQTGRQLVETLGAQKKPGVREALERDFGDTLAVHVIRGRDDYPQMLEILAQASLERGLEPAGASL